MVWFHIFPQPLSKYTEDEGEVTWYQLKQYSLWASSSNSTPFWNKPEVLDVNSSTR